MITYVNLSIFLSCLFEREKSVVSTSGICSTKLQKDMCAPKVGESLYTLEKAATWACHSCCSQRELVAMQNLRSQALGCEHLRNNASSFFLKPPQNISWPTPIFYWCLSHLASVIKSFSWDVCEKLLQVFLWGACVSNLVDEASWNLSDSS